jgi:hypothetical protein
MGDKKFPKIFVMGNFTAQDQQQTENKVARYRPEGCITDPRNKRLVGDQL